MDATSPASRRRSERAWSALEDGIAKMHPAYFAMSMATGIVSIACHLLGLHDLSNLLFWASAPIYCTLWLATIARALLHPKDFLADWTSHQRAPGFFTTVAATCVLGVQFARLGGSPGIGVALWAFGALLWLACMYAIFISLHIGEPKPSLAEGMHSGWLVAVVATQSICVLGARVLPDRFESRDAVLFSLLAVWLCGGMLYGWMITLIFQRYLFSRCAPKDLLPPYWINMGALAISTLAGTSLIAASGSSPLMASLGPFLKGLTIAYWAVASWWIPLLLGLGAWRHVVRRVGFTYDPLYWSLVFPIGMYCVCTHRVAETLDLPFLVWASRLFIVAAIIAWMLTLFGLTQRLMHPILLASRSWRRRWPAMEHLASSSHTIDGSSLGGPSNGAPR
ncbi:MAG: tellurite resistance/C4-dicarboxylate transporter family protein [Sandaracinaceae bacterium]|nr:tellurite resistance/C4-dicarboxylate transporter family protein [Sandaracinaceae bacterium]